MRRSIYLLLFLVLAAAACESPHDVVLPDGRAVYCSSTCRIARAGEDREIGLHSRHVRRTERIIGDRLLRCDWYTLPRYREREVVRCGWVER